MSPSGTEKIEYAGEILVSAAGASPELYYIGARWMDSELGRWLSLDPELGSLSSPQSLNRYVYCVNNPLKFVDPTGEFSFSKWWDKNWKTLAIIAAVTIITAATGGAGGIAAAMILGALSQGAIYAVEAGSSFTWQGLAVNMGLGAAAGAIGYGAGIAVSKIASKYASGAATRSLSKVFGFGKMESGYIASPGEKAGLGLRTLFRHDFVRVSGETSLGRVAGGGGWWAARGFDVGGEAAQAFRMATGSEISVSSRQLVVAGSFARTIWESQGSWSQLARWGAEVLGGVAFHEAARHYAEAPMNLPGYAL